ncbi:hypothetical protein [Allorhizobium undicola]|uniref:hypothetical protein n=1 Tax=Allorhizobium undicola TaxID=78527 RepID=UPI0012B5DDB4|nr:hypothetical protein [Allorhizobium undicola]
MTDFEESKGEQNGIVARTNARRFHVCSAYAIALPSRGEIGKMKALPKSLKKAVITNSL